MIGIGEMARASGLSASTLRFYDGAGVLVPARVDPMSGYRRYGPEQVAEARLVARLRRAGMAVADIRLVLAGWSGTDAELVRKLLEAHLRRLEQRLGAARVEFSEVRALLEDRENPMTPPRPTAVRLTVPAPELAAALDAVRFAASTDPELPVLGGVLFDAEGDTLRTVATDRYRMAVARAAAGGHDGPRAQAVVPSPLVDAMRALLTDDVTVTLSVDGDRVTLTAGEREVAGRLLAHDYPDYRRLVQLPEGTRATVDVTAFRTEVAQGPSRTGEAQGPGGTACELSLLRVTGDGTVTVGEEGDVAVNREFLLDALDAGARDRLVLEFGTPTGPVAIRRPDSKDAFSLLMPVRLES
ncbi:hypothetical protein SRB5_63590 [Streptomyces sp. RB5]|uniref:HTH merR-type domain-containing protein n=1 Tax=Streptomyces smaragdinus TaxID=2585196 RepID=A0A7K0CRP6_9ACTN|nr:MerR family transcriptional regulator [Streptomyces smaragdinus]MQY16165.1 hypothetical protein [Streptomyces smaragdinus]